MKLDTGLPTPDGRASMGGRRVWSVLLKVVVAAAACLWLASRGYLDERAVFRVDPLSLILGIGLLGLQNAGNGLRLWWLLRSHGLAMGLGRCMALTWVGFAFNQLLPGGAGGDALRAYYAAQDNPRARTHAVAAAVVDKAVGLTGLLLLATLPAALVQLHPEGIPPRVVELVRAVSATMMFGCLGIAVAAALVTSRRAAVLFANSQLLASLGRRAPRIAQLTQAVIAPHRGRRTQLLGFTLFSAALHLLSCVVLIVVARALGNRESIALHLSLWCVTFLTTAIPISPGGVGVSEAAAAKLWSWCGVSTGATTYLVLRLLSLVHAAAGLIVYVALRRQQQQQSEASEPSQQRIVQAEF